jgi:hypothetical protein
MITQSVAPLRAFLKLVVLILAPGLLAQTSVNMITTARVIDHQGVEAWSIKQSGTGTSSSTTGITFGFQKLGDVMEGHFNQEGMELVAVKVTHRFLAQGAEINITNNNVSLFTFATGDRASITPTMDTWIWGLHNLSLRSDRIYDDDLDQFVSEFIAQKSSFEFRTDQDLSGIELTAGQTKSYNLDIDIVKSGEVYADDIYRYEGTGAWLTQIYNTFETSQRITGSNITINTELPQGFYTVEVEYIVVPEPGSLILMGLAGVAVLLLYRNMRKRFT